MINSILSVHFPKAGGSSLKSSLKKALPRHEFLEQYNDDPIVKESLCNKSLIQSQQEAYHNLKDKKNPYIIHGHFPAKKFNLLDFDARISIVRHPISWAISLNNYWNQLADKGMSGHSLFVKFKKERPSIEEFFENYEVLRTCLSGSYFTKDDIYNFDFIGIHEKYSESIVKIGKILEVNLTERRSNVTKRKKIKQKDLNPKTLNRLYELFHQDIKLYEQIVNRFW